MPSPTWALAIAFWLHMLATVVWIGGIVTLGIIFLPSAYRILKSKEYAALLGEVQKRLDPISWFSLIVLVGTGMFQMSANPHYGGFLAINNNWTTVMLLKHLVFLVMTIISIYITWMLLPKMSRAALRRAHETNSRTESSSEDTPEKQLLILQRLNLVLGVLVLGLTAVARAI
ncbi:CopD family protein [Chloroflexota bacterium]